MYLKRNISYNLKDEQYCMSLDKDNKVLKSISNLDITDCDILISCCYLALNLKRGKLR